MKVILFEKENLYLPNSIPYRGMNQHMIKHKAVELIKHKRLLDRCLRNQTKLGMRFDNMVCFLGSLMTCNLLVHNNILQVPE